MAWRSARSRRLSSGHVSLEIEGLDRIRYVLALQTSGQVAGITGLVQVPDRLAAALGKVSQEFRAAVRQYADSK